MGARWMIRWTAICSIVLGVAACSSGSGTAEATTTPGAGAGEPQTFELTIDGTRHTWRVDNQNSDELVGLGLVTQINPGISITALSKSKNITFQLMVYEPIEPGKYEVYGCNYGSCPSGYSHGRAGRVGPYPNMAAPEQIDVAQWKQAYKIPELELQPMILTITSIEDAVLDGVGPTKRVKGTFTGDLVTLMKNANNELYLHGPTKHVEGKFDLYRTGGL